MSLLRARFDECQSGLARRTMGDRCPVSEHAKRQESVDLRHLQCSLKSVESTSHRKVISIIEERGKSEELESSRRNASLVELRDRALLCCSTSQGVAVSCTRTNNIALSKQSDRD